MFIKLYCDNWGEEIVKKVIYAISVFVFLCLGYMIGLQVERRQQDALKNQQENILKIAIVNMDDGVIQEENQVNYASQLINLLNEDFVMTGLNDAKIGITNGLYAAYIVVPEQFSESVTSIENNPKKITLEYKINSNLNNETEIQTVNNINSFINAINSNIAFMYMDAILTEFHDVQDNSTTILKNDNTELSRLENIDASQLVVVAEAVEELTVDYNIATVDLIPYTNQNNTIMEALVLAHSEAIQKGKSEYSNIQDTNSEVNEASNNFFNLYDTVINDIDTNQRSLLEIGKTNLGNVIRLYNQNISEKKKTMTNQISDIVGKQIAADSDSANGQLKNILTNVNGSKTEELKNQEEKWKSFVEKLKIFADEEIDDIKPTILEEYQISVDNQINSIIKEAYKQGVTDAFTVIEREITTEESEEKPEEESEEELEQIIDLNEKKFSINNIIQIHNKYTSEKLEENVNTYLTGVEEITISDDEIEEIKINWDSFNIPVPSYTQTDKKESNEEESNEEDSSEEESSEEEKPTITLQICEEAKRTNVESLSNSFTELFALESNGKLIDSVIQTDFHEALLNENIVQRSRLANSKDVLNQSMDTYEKKLTEFDPLRYVEEANLNRYLTDIKLNSETMLGTIENNNSEHILYSSNVYSTTFENSMKLKNSLSEANNQSISNVGSCIDDLKISRENVNGQNSDMLTGFTESLKYTRVNSQGNSEVYDYIINPVKSLNTGEKIIGTNTESSNSKISLKEILLIIFGIGIVVCIGEFLISVRKKYKADREESSDIF